MKNACRKPQSRMLSALLALLTALPLLAGLVPIGASAVDQLLYSDYFSEYLDFEDLAPDTVLTAAYLEGKIDSKDLFSSVADNGGSYAPINWKAVTDPTDADNTAIGLVNPNGFAMFRLVDDKKELYEKPFVLSFRMMLNGSIDANTTLLGWATSTDKRMRVLGISGTELRYGTGSSNDNNTATVSAAPLK